MKKKFKMWSAFYCFYIIYSAENELSKKTLNTILNMMFKAQQWQTTILKLLFYSL